MKKIEIEKIIIPPRLRKVDHGKVEQLSGSISLLGLLNEIIINQKNELIAGAHRLEACRKLGKIEIQVKIIDTDEPLLSALIEIDENLCRNDLDVLSAGEHIIKRDRILKEMGLRAKAGDNQFKVSGGIPGTLPEFITSEVIASQIGISKTTYYRRAQIARNIPGDVKKILKSRGYGDSTRALLILSKEDKKIQRKVANVLKKQDIGDTQKKTDFIRKQIRSIKRPELPKVKPPETDVEVERYLLIDPAPRNKFPNLGLMKWGRWCENEEHYYEFVKGVSEKVVAKRVVNGVLAKHELNRKIVPLERPSVIVMSCIFSYHSSKFLDVYEYYSTLYPRARWLIGGPATTALSEWFSDNMEGAEIIKGIYEPIEKLIPKYSLEPDQKIIVTHASRGCVHRCGFCIVPRIEGRMRSYKSVRKYLETGLEELNNAEKVLLIDNIFTEHEHFDDIINELKNFKLPLDVYGLHLESFDAHKAKLLSGLSFAGQGDSGTSYLRFSYDDTFVEGSEKETAYLDNLQNALALCKKYQMGAGFFLYMLFGYRDSLECVYNKIRQVQGIVDKVGRDIFVFPQRYQPLNCLEKNTFVDKGWSPEELLGFSKIYTHLRGFVSITKSGNIWNWLGRSFDEFRENCINASVKTDYKPAKKEQVFVN